MSPSTRSKPARRIAPAPVFAALGDATRLRLVGRLSEQSPQSVSSLTQHSKLTRQAISKHLRVLEDAGLVENVRSGRESLYALRAEPIDDARQYLETVARQWDDALQRLKLFVETET